MSRRSIRTPFASTVLAVGLVLGTAGAATASADAPRAGGHTATYPGWPTHGSRRGSSNTRDLAALFTRDGVYIDRAADKVSRGRSGVAAWEKGSHRLMAHIDGKLVDSFRSGNRMVIPSVYRGQIGTASPTRSLSRW